MSGSAQPPPPGYKINKLAMMCPPIDNWVTLKVYDVLGREVATLVDGFKDGGYYNVEFRMSDY
ncbi:MAG: hypothetical protein QME58_14365 [Bacteroidota bacterium]|nr:hypothetical protein [Bacteroidota bacterium]